MVAEVDMHTHSYFSDGLESPSKIAFLANKIGPKGYLFNRS